MSHSVLIQGRKIVLRDWRLEDLELFEQWNQPGHAWKETDAPYYPLGDARSATAALRKQIEAADFKSARQQLVIAEAKSNKLIGFVSSYWESIETNWLCIGIVIYDDSFWGKGIGAEALALWITYLFSAHSEIVRLDMRTWSGNDGLQALARKLGFKEEARFRRARIVHGKYYDGLAYGILREEWQSK